MEAILLIGIQGSGKSTFCRGRCFDDRVTLAPGGGFLVTEATPLKGPPSAGA